MRRGLRLPRAWPVREESVPPQTQEAAAAQFADAWLQQPQQSTLQQ